LRDANVPCALWFGCGWNDASLPALPLETLITRPQTHIATALWTSHRLWTVTARAGASGYPVFTKSNGISVFTGMTGEKRGDQHTCPNTIVFAAHFSPARCMRLRPNLLAQHCWSTAWAA